MSKKQVAQTLGLTERRLLALVGRALFGSSSDMLPERLAPEETAALLDEAHRQAVTALALDGFEEPSLKMDPASYKAWVAAARAVIANTDRVFRSHAYAAKSMESLNAPYAILKGCASALAYPKPYLRVMGDVDFLVPADRLADVETLLKNDGYLPIRHTERHLCHRTFRKNGRDSLEVHFNPPGIPYGTAAEKPVRKISDGILKTAVTVNAGGFSLRVPDDFHQFFVLLLHIQHHLVSCGVGLRHLCDLAVFFASRVTRDSWEDKLAPALKECGLYSFAGALLAAAHLFLGMPSHGVDFETDSRTAELVISDIFAGGNFGRKNKSRSDAAYLAADTTSSTSRRGLFSQMFVTLARISGARYPVTKKVPVLLVFTVPYDVLRYFWRALTGKRAMLGADTVRYAKERKALFEKLHMFEPET